MQKLSILLKQWQMNVQMPLLSFLEVRYPTNHHYIPQKFHTNSWYLKLHNSKHRNRLSLRWPLWSGRRPCFPIRFWQQFRSSWPRQCWGQDTPSRSGKRFALLCRDMLRCESFPLVMSYSYGKSPFLKGKLTISMAISQSSRLGQVIIIKCN